MPELFYLFYFFVLAMASIFSGKAYLKGDKKSVYLTVLLIITLVFEILMMVWEKQGVKKYLFLVDVFASVEYLFFCLYAVNASKGNKANVWIRASIGLFAVFSSGAAFLVFHYGKRYFEWITWDINIEGFLLFIIYTYVLFNINDDVPLPIYKHPDFWIAIGILVFYGGVFVMLGLYPVLAKIDPSIAGFDYSAVLRPLNLFLYFCITSGSICFLTNTKFLIR